MSFVNAPLSEKYKLFAFSAHCDFQSSNPAYFLLMVEGNLFYAL